MIERGDMTIAIYGLNYNEKFLSLLKITADSSGNPRLEFENIPDEGDTKRYNILIIHQKKKNYTFLHCFQKFVLG